MSTFPGLNTQNIKIPFPAERLKRISRESIMFYNLCESDLRNYKTHKYDHIA